MGPLESTSLPTEGSMPQGKINFSEGREEEFRKLSDKIGNKISSASSSSLRNFVNRRFLCNYKLEPRPLGVIIEFFHREFPLTEPKNLTIQPSDSFVAAEDLNEAVRKAERVYEAFKQMCVQKSIEKMPNRLFKKCNLTEHELGLITEVFLHLTESFKNKYFEEVFDLDFRRKILPLIDYLLGIPPSARSSDRISK